MAGRPRFNEKEARMNISVSMPPSLIMALEAAAKNVNNSRSEYIERLIYKALRSN